MVDSDFTISNLLCQEDGACLDEEENSEMCGILLPDGTPQDDEYIEVLLNRESGCCERGSNGHVSVSPTTDWLKCARSNAVKWILKTRKRFGFSFQTAFLSVTYLDRFFERRTIESRQVWAIQLLAVACLSIAAKLEECRVPLLSQFEVEEYHFNTNLVQRMELLVLTTLDWRMRSVTPFPYLSYLVPKMEYKLQHRELMVRAAELILAAIEKINLVDYRPSVIAMAAFFAASGHELTKKLLESAMDTISLSGDLEAENVLSCYDVIRVTEKERLKIGTKLISENISFTDPSIHSSIDDPNGTTTLTRIGGKRRRLELKLE